MDKGFEQTFIQNGYTVATKCVKRCSTSPIINKTDQNHNEISLYTCEDGHCQKNK